jgi:Transposase DDE domain
MKSRATRVAQKNPAPRSNIGEAVEAALRSTFTATVVDELREQTGYNPRQRLVTAQRLMLVVVEAFLLGQTLGFAAIRAIFLRRFGFVRPCPFQKRFKQASAAAFFRAALERLVESVIRSAQLSLTGPLAQFADVRVYDGTGQRVPARGREALPGCTKGKAGSKWVVGYSIKTGLLEHAESGAETASETPLWHKLVPSFTRGVLYLFDLGFFERKLFAAAQDTGAHVLMRLKKTAKVSVVGHVVDRSLGVIPSWSLSYYLTSVTRRRGTLFDLDVVWGKGRDVIGLRLVGIAHTSRTIRWYLTTVPRSQLSARQIVQAYRLRWLIELLFREIKQATDLGRSFTADANAVQAMTYGAMLAHVLVRSLRIQAALDNEVPLEQLRPLACLHIARAFARDIIDALAATTRRAWFRISHAVGLAIVQLARELKPSRSRPRIALNLGAVGA